MSDVPLAATSAAKFSKGALQLMLTAERLFGEHGIEGVSLRQIVTAAGQANSSAVQHHFGSKEGLVQAVYDMRLPELEAGRMRRLEQIKDQAGYVAVPQLLRALYLTVVLDFDELAQRHLSQFNLRLMQVSLLDHPFYKTTVPQPAFKEIEARLYEHFAYLPQRVFQSRMRLASELFYGAVNEYRQLTRLQPNPYPDAMVYWNEIMQAIESVYRIPYTAIAD